MQNLIVILILLAVLYWYFNVRGKTRCIPIISEKENINYIKENSTGKK